MSLCVDDQLGGLTYAIIGMAMVVHHELGPRHRKAIYHRAMHQQLRKRGFASEYEPRLPALDRPGNLVTVYRPDHRVEHVIPVSYNAHFSPLTNDEIAQCLKYFGALDGNMCLLFNFDRPRLEWKRPFPHKNIAPSSSPTKITTFLQQNITMHG